MAEKRPEIPKPEGLQVMKTLPELELDDKQLVQYGMREIEILLEKHSEFNEWLVAHGRR